MSLFWGVILEKYTSELLLLVYESQINQFQTPESLENFQ